MLEEAQDAIHQLIRFLTTHQSEDGSWHFCFESTPMTDAYMILLIRALEMEDEEALVQELVRRLEWTQSSVGSWKAYPDEKEGNLSLTIEAYTALLFSGYVDRQELTMMKARRFIKMHGGIRAASSMTKVVLAVMGEYDWPVFLPVPLEFILLPNSAPLNFYDLSVYARAHMTPVLLLADHKFSVHLSKKTELAELIGDRTSDDWRLNEGRSFSSFIQEAVETLNGLPHELHKEAALKAVQYMFDHLEADGTFYSYFSSTFLMIFALLAHGYSKKAPVILKAFEGLKGHLSRTRGTLHAQNAVSRVWDTALLSYAMQEAGIRYDHPSVQAANQFLLRHQHTNYGDWAIHNPHVKPGGWGFSHTNTMNPDVDDTAAALRALRPAAKHQQAVFEHWHRGLAWILSMQNDDGGWASFEKNTDKKILKLIPFDGADAASIDESSADLTGRVLEFLGHFTGLPSTYPKIKNGVEWLRRNQEADGSWYARWEVGYIYGTWAAITGMRAVNLHPEDPTIQKGIRFLLKNQNEDGGWGESCENDVVKHYVPLGKSTLSQTAWAVDALISVYDKPTPEMDRGIKSLLTQLSQFQDTFTYPTGAGLPGTFYTYYHSYNLIWPLLTLGHYLN
ncbi:squalene--hopene cyclase [Pullulanibacillus sp. KACC 23026]|uniref:squalene--hopene cyclase n=1 Tax=Pullulanibacillus sp. KACC 23026 TaxID=3028315 RepID=UPI0023AF4A46|nr:squalene--hopene cyclase [Pullulanibacillus sp. KACC 23026]WEG14422.1 squalene--hopene cyclase [Pullulanibacillus sp. KACC 23026]